MKRQKITENLIKLLPAVLLIILSVYLLKGDGWTFWTWYLLAAVMGMLCMPLTGLLFKDFADKGWMFSKVLAVMLTGFLTWFLVSVKLLKFTSVTCIGVSAVCAAFCIFLYFRQEKAGIECLPVKNLELVYWEEILFLAFFLMWTYFAGFHPAANGNTEKFMDYGFMEAMMRSETLPATDIWYSSGKINYYYGGQYFAVFLTKLSGTKVELTYNLMRTFVAGLAFSLPFSLVWQMVSDRMSSVPGITGWKKYLPAMTGFVAGGSVSIAGNMHYVIYAVIIPFIQKMTGQEVDSYWFPDATRYIGYNPENDADKTIHEFPCYSFVLGDLHAHVVNVMFVLLLLGLLYAWMQRVKKDRFAPEQLRDRRFWKKQLLQPQLLAAAVLLGMYHWTNYWDFVIYFVVTGGVVLFMNIICMEGRWKLVLAVTAAQAIEIFALATVVILPFTLQFKTMVSGVALAQHHTLWYQLLVLWGLPAGLVTVFVISLLAEKIKEMKKIPAAAANTEAVPVDMADSAERAAVTALSGKNTENVVSASETTAGNEREASMAPGNALSRVMTMTELPDLFAVIMGLCAMGLVLIPELVYVRDIYENGNARANTMFKLTYQAYIMFGMTMAYVIFRMLIVTRKKLLKVIAGIGLFFLLWTWGYFDNSVSAWFGQVWDQSQYKGLNAVAYLESDYPEDAAAIRWLKKNIEDSPVVLEANGNSYTNYDRVSAMTGLPTVLGWYVHEWLWRNDVADLNLRSADVETIYTATSEDTLKELLEKYDVSYIFVGSCEREKYGSNLNNDLIRSLGEVVFQDSEYDTYIVKVN